MKKSYFCFGSRLAVRADKGLDQAVIKELWNGFCFQCGTLDLTAREEFHFRTGEIQYPELTEGKEYVICVARTGIAVTAKDSKSLARAVMVLMLRIEVVDLTEGREQFRIETCLLESAYLIENRMIHFCIFPETTPAFLKKCIRLAGIMQYTHVVLEFWGSLQFDCLKELAWPNAYSKAFAKSLVKEIEAMGMQAIPMMNHLGHASGCRVSGGKHVVLDQNPRLAVLFAPDGWSWRIDCARVQDLLKAARQELYEIFDKAEYIHLGCDEVYSYEKGEENQRMMRVYLSDLTRKVVGEGKRPIIWGDMLLNPEACQVEKPYFCGCDTPEHARKLLAAIAPETIIADWHYDVREVPVRTSVYLKAHGFNVLGVPWFLTENGEAHVKTICDYDLMGIMVSTWHTLAQHMPHIVIDAMLCGAYHSPWSGKEINEIRTETAALLRKIYFVEGEYKEAGWTDSQIFLQANPMT